MLMIIVILALLGLILGSFVNALVWRLYMQLKESKGKNKKATQLDKTDLSILKGRSMCPHCHHTLSGTDLVPVLSWLFLKGKCRYCHKDISIQYPIVEITTAFLFVMSYVWWPTSIEGLQVALFVLWLALLVGLMALLVYDLKWLLLPNRLANPLSYLALIYAVLVNSSKPLVGLVDCILAVVIGGGIFYALFLVSNGEWIGGGDVRLGWLLGLIAGTPGKAILFIFLASIIGTIISLPLVMSHRLKRRSLIPFGPFLIAGLVITELFGSHILHWYTHILIR
jgi:prepilin signal peptidase PulO-like enzyme (type II secretory pathway)